MGFNKSLGKREARLEMQGVGSPTGVDAESNRSYLLTAERDRLSGTIDLFRDVLLKAIL